MSVIYLNAAHTPFSPGGVFSDTTEHGEVLKLCTQIKQSLLRLDGSLRVEIVTGNFIFPAVKSEDFLLVFHKGINGKNQHKHGCEILVKPDADAAYQYKAYRLLCSLCKSTLRFRGVHTATAGSPFRFFINTPAKNAYLVMAGYIESEGDREIFDRLGTELAESLSRELINVYKEKNNEDYT